MYTVLHAKHVNEPGPSAFRITVTSVFSSVVERGGILACVALNGMAAEVVVNWPKLLVDLDMMDKKLLPDLFVRKEKYYPEYAWCARIMKSFWAQSSDWTEPKAWITFTHCVQSFILDKYNLSWRDDYIGMVYIPLKTWRWPMCNKKWQGRVWNSLSTISLLQYAR